MKKYKFGVLALLATFMLSFSGCFNLDEEAFSEVTPDTFIPTQQDVAALMAAAYKPLSYIYDWQGLFDAQEESGDVIITPTRPNGWDDGGTYRRMHQHKWNDQEWQPWNCYITPLDAIQAANRVIKQLEEESVPAGELKEPTIAELRAVRALWYASLVDTHGNVPIVEKYTDELPTQSTRKEVFDFIVKELTEVMPLLSKANDASTYGRMNVWAAHALLTRLYLNAEVYTGTAMWDKAIEHADAIINSGLFALAADYSDNFAVDVDYTNKEFIFAIPMDNQYAGFNMCHKWFPPNAKYSFGGSMANYFWGGSCANPQFINAYEPGDHRLEKTWLMGKQYSATNPNEVIWECINYLPSLTCFKDGVNHTSINWGYRVWKFEYNYDTPNGVWSNDIGYFRYAETLLSKAEALMRSGKNEAEAARLVSMIRARVFDDPAQATVTADDLKADTRIQYGTLDWDNNIDIPGDQTPVVLGGLYDEWGFEFACEAQRRTQMIRFGTYNTKNWFNHEATPAHTALFPIPLEELQKNGNLKQNPGY